MTPPLLETLSLCHTFPDGTKALDNVDLSFHAGSFVVLAGANGSGKTVFMRHLNGLARPTSGEVLLHGNSVLNDRSRARRSIGLVFQDADAQIVGQTVAKDAAFGPENLRLPRHEIDKLVKEALSATGLVGFDERRPHTLSGGEKRRLAVAGVLAMEPEMLVLDEPFTGLDSETCEVLVDYFGGQRHRGNNKTLLIASHSQEWVKRVCDRAITLRHGKIAGEFSF